MWSSLRSPASRSARTTSLLTASSSGRASGCTGAAGSRGGDLTVRVAYLGPAGTFTDDALRDAAAGAELEAVPAPSVYAAIVAVEDGEADRAFVPFENSIEGAVRATLDTLAFDASGVTLVGDHDFPITHCLIAREPLELDRIEVVLSHP